MFTRTSLVRWWRQHRGHSFAISYAVFLVSLCLPAVASLESPHSAVGQPAIGLQVVFMAPVVIVAMPVVVYALPQLIGLMFLPISAIVEMASPLIIHRCGTIGAGVVVAAAAVSIVVTLLVPVDISGAKFIGYHLWMVAQIGFAVTCSFGWIIPDEHKLS